jgi:glycosyltransferase involved in cell wall biosynthesis
LSNLGRNSPETIRVFVHLARGFGTPQWQERWDRGEIIGLTERCPYGYSLAQEDGCVVKYSEDRCEGALGTVCRLGARLVLGFDFIHAWRNRHAIRTAEVIWTGTESQSLAILLLLRWHRGRDRPKVIAQLVWLFDRWPRLSGFKRWLYSRLLADAAVLAVQSKEALPLAHTLFPRKRAVFMPFSIGSGAIISSRAHQAHHPIRVFSAGNDRHRDWATIVAAIRDWPGAELRILTPRLPAGLQFGANVRRVRPTSKDELFELYRWADVVALALHRNFHGSGITVIEEATIFGVPAVVTDVGGLRDYFSDQELRYVQGSNPRAMRDAIAAVAADEASARMVERAQRRMVEAELTSRGFAFRHAALSREMLGLGGGSRYPSAECLPRF